MLFEKIELEKNEEILKMVRKHWFIIAAELFGTVMMAFFPFFILAAVAGFNHYSSIHINIGNHTVFIVYATAAWLLLTTMSGFMIWTHYYLDLWIITDRRIILIDQIHFFNRNVSIFRLERLQDIEFYIKGIIPTFLNFGTIKAQTAGAFESNFKTNGLPNPRELQAIIQKAMDQRLAELHNPSLLE
ncbi:PH domain-containing protein [Candidatus Kaiserbacteria bacterium]|nr:PH domain-containing protein [Candidatus Kaiserbacteria bacterium]